MSIREFAEVRQLDVKSQASRSPSQMPWPRVLLIEHDPRYTQGFFLNAWAANGDFGGDTWHTTLAEAKEQANYQFGAYLGEWRQIPTEVPDARAYALARVSVQPD